MLFRSERGAHRIFRDVSHREPCGVAVGRQNGDRDEVLAAFMVRAEGLRVGRSFRNCVNQCGNESASAGSAAAPVSEGVGGEAGPGWSGIRPRCQKKDG